jgi:hypothetical protein
VGSGGEGGDVGVVKDGRGEGTLVGRDVTPGVGVGEVAPPPQDAKKRDKAERARRIMPGVWVLDIASSS